MSIKTQSNIGQSKQSADDVIIPASGESIHGAPPFDDAQSSSKFSSNWLANISPQKRAILKELHEIKPVWNWIALFFPVMWGLIGVVVMSFPSWPVRILGYISMGTAIHGMAVLTHEASHYNMFRSRFFDRWLGFLMGAPVFISHTAYRVAHVDHHRYTREQRDPDEFNNVTKHRLLLSIFFYSWLVIGTPVYLFHVAITAMIRGSWRDRFDVLTEYALLVLLFGGVYKLLVYYGRTDLIVHCWALPMITAMVFANVRSWAEHTMTIPGDSYTRTRTVTSNKVVSLLMCNLNYHLEHHLLQSIPWYNMPKMHALLQEEYKKANSFIYKSYWRFLYDAFRTGVHGIAYWPSM